jgi:hypothetical protein
MGVGQKKRRVGKVYFGGAKKAIMAKIMTNLNDSDKQYLWLVEVEQIKPWLRICIHCKNSFDINSNYLSL